jgi:hypothetical protein
VVAISDSRSGLKTAERVSKFMSWFYLFLWKYSFSESELSGRTDKYNKQNTTSPEIVFSNYDIVKVKVNLSLYLTNCRSR